ncbi:zinc-binding dehydrogenase [bacterium]|nr:zinc-binding dehydrogenase [bacterium]
MKAVVRSRYGSPAVLSLRDVPPPEPTEDEVLIRVHATSLNAYDWRMLRADPFFIRFAEGLLRPKMSILGADTAGTVEEVGKNVTRFKPGDEVFGSLSETRCGGLAEFVCTRENYLAGKPETVSFEEAAAVPMAALTALQAFRDEGNVQPGQQVLINGASGGVGTFAVQIAKVLGAEVTAVCSTGKIELMRELGADHVIDYKRESITQGGRAYNMILAVNGYQTLSDYVSILAPGGVYMAVGGTMRQIFAAMLKGPRIAKKNGFKIGSMTEKPNSRDLAVMGEWLKTGKVKPVIDKVYALEETAAAFRHLEEGHARGKIVVSMRSSN